MMKKKELVTPNLVHKTELEDVLIYEAEVVLANIIEQNDFNDLITNNPEQESLLKAVYKLCRSGEKNIYVLRTLPLQIPKSIVYELFPDIHLTEFYKPIDDETLELISGYVPLHLEEIIRSKLLPTVLPIDNNDKKIISNIQSAAIVHSYFLFNNIKNQYFYKKSHEHVPGMMLIEAARQAVYDYVYSTSGHVFKEVSISMTNLEVNFLGYTVSSYPVELLFSHKDYVRRFKPKTIEKKAWFYQRGKLTGTFCLIGGIIPMSIFPRLRNENYLKALNFYPFDENMKLKVLSDENSEVLHKKIICLSLTGIIIENDGTNMHNVSNVVLMDKHEFSIKKHEIKEEDNNCLSLLFDNLSKSQLLTLNNIINTSFYHRRMFEALNI